MSLIFPPEGVAPSEFAAPLCGPLSRTAEPLRQAKDASDARKEEREETSRAARASLALARKVVAVLALLAFSGCASDSPALHSVRAARGLLDLAAPVSTMSRLQRDEWRKQQTEWRALSIRIAPERE